MTTRACGGQSCWRQRVRQPCSGIVVGCRRNQFKKLADEGVEHAGFDEDEETVGLLSVDDELREAGFTEDDVIKDALAAIVLYPED